MEMLLFPELEFQPRRHRPHNFVSSATLLRKERKRVHREEFLKMKAEREAARRRERETTSALYRELDAINWVRVHKGRCAWHSKDGIIVKLNLGARMKVMACAAALERDGDHAIMARVLQFGLSAFEEWEREGKSPAMLECRFLDTPEGVEHFMDAVRDAPIWMAMIMQAGDHADIQIYDENYDEVVIDVRRLYEEEEEEALGVQERTYG